LLLSINYEFFILGITLLSQLILLLFLIRIKIKGQIHYAFISIILLLCIWNIGANLERSAYIKGYVNMVFVNISFFAVFFTPISVLSLCVIYAKTSIKFKYRYLLLFIVPMLSTIIILTNNYHHLFFEKYSFLRDDVTFGKYFVFHSIYSYSLMLIGIIYMLYFTIKNTGVFSKQSIFMTLGIVFPLFINVLYTLKIIVLTNSATPISFSIAIVFFYIAIFKYDFLSVMPIAMQTVIDRISNGILVIDMQGRIIDYNMTLYNSLKDLVELKRKESVYKLSGNFKSVSFSNFKKHIDQVIETRKPLSLEYYFEENNFNACFNIEVTPIIKKYVQLGMIIMFTDITEQKYQLKTIHEQQQQMIEIERLASLGTLMGGISHNLKTPLMSISGCITSLEDLSNEYKESIGNPIVEANDHYEMAEEMLGYLKELRGHVSYISTALTAIKNQVINPDSRKGARFTLNELILNIEFLMKYETKSNYCTLSIRTEVNGEYLINGDIGTLVQIINNLISNSIQSYPKISTVTESDILKRKIILLIVEEDNHLVFKVIDYGMGIPIDVQDKLFKEMTTTKGKDGSGIGLYMSFTKIKSMFKGDMWFESVQGKGTTFYVKITP